VNAQNGSKPAAVLPDNPTIRISVFVEKPVHRFPEKGSQLMKN